MGAHKMTVKLVSINDERWTRYFFRQFITGL
jgi:hypothetical protein